jgi:hypothetical protein
MEIPGPGGQRHRRAGSHGCAPVAIVNQVFANVYFPGAWPIGQHFRVGGDKNGIEVQIVGVAKSARYDSLKNKIPPVTYLSYLQTAKKWRLQQMFFESRTAENPFSAGEYCQGNRASGKPARTGCRCTDTSPNDRRNDCAGANICCIGASRKVNTSALR